MGRRGVLQSQLFERSMHLMPKRLDKPEWRHTQDYWAERDELPLVDLDEGCLVFE